MDIEKIKKTIEKIKRQILIGESEKNIGIPVYISDLKILLAELNEKDRLINFILEDIRRRSIDGVISIEKLLREYKEKLKKESD